MLNNHKLNFKKIYDNSAHTNQILLIYKISEKFVKPKRKVL